MQGSAKSMVLSMIACIAGCLVLLALIPRQGPTPRPTVGVAPIAREVRDTTGWDVAAADSAPTPWRAVDAQIVAGDADHVKHWQVGYQGKGSDFVVIEQAKNGGATFVRQFAAGTSAGTLSVGGVTWTKVDLSTGDQKALVRTTPLGGLDTVVTGVGTWDRLAQIAAAAKPYSATH